jgi:hypothetical protein
MAKKNQSINMFLGVLVIALVVFLFFVYNDKGESNLEEENPFYLGDGRICEEVVERNNYRFCSEVFSENLTIYKLEFFVGNNERIIHSFRHLPEELEDINVEEGIGAPLVIPGSDVVKNKVYLSMDPEFTGDEILVALWLPAQVLGRSNVGVFKMDVTSAFSKDYNGSDYPIRSCSDADDQTAVIEYRRGDKKLEIEDNCIVAYGKNETEFNMVSEALTYRLIGVVQSE